MEQVSDKRNLRPPRWDQSAAAHGRNPDLVSSSPTSSRQKNTPWWGGHEATREACQKCLPQPKLNTSARQSITMTCDCPDLCHFIATSALCASEAPKIGTMTHASSESAHRLGASAHVQGKFAGAPQEGLPGASHTRPLPFRKQRVPANGRLNVTLGLGKTTGLFRGLSQLQHLAKH